MKQAQIKISLQIHSIKLQVKFPCSIAAALRIETEELPFPQEVPLRMGEALFDQSVSHQITLLFDSARKAFQQKKIAVLLFLKSTSGRIPAGSVSLGINSIVKGVSHQAIPVEKCPDKRAIVELSITCDILNEVDLNSGEGNTGRISPRSSEANKRMTFGPAVQSRPMKGSMMDQSAYRKRGVQKEDGVTPRTSKEIESKNNEVVRSELQKSTSGFRGELDTQSHQSPHHYTEYSLRSKTNHLERELKTYQSKCEQQNMELKNVTGKKDILQRSLKENEGQLRLFKQKYEDLKIQYDNVLKKCQYKDNSSKQQIRILTEKLAASESEKQRMIFQRNDMMNDFEGREKDLRLGLKEKENSVNSEKNRLAKTVERLTTQLNELRTHQLDSSSKQKQFLKELAQQRKKYQNLQLKNSDLLQDIGVLKTEIGEKKAQILHLEQALHANVQLEEEKKKFRKKIGDLELQITNHLKNNATSEANAQRCQRKCEELQEMLKEKTNILKNLQRETQNLSNESSVLKNTIQDQQIKLQEFTSSKQRQSQKQQSVIRQLNENLKKLQEEIKANLSELKYKDNVISGLKEQMENDHGEIASIDKKNSELQIQLMESKNNITKLQYQIEQLTSAKEHLETEKSELEVQINSSLQELETIDRERKEERAERQDEKRKFETKIKSLQYSIHNSTEESSFQMKELQRKLLDLTQESASKSQQIEILHGQISGLEEEKALGLKQNEELAYNLKLKENQSTFLNQSLQKAHQDITNSIAENKKQQLEIQSLKKTIDDLQQELQQLHEELSHANSSGSNTRQELADYKAKNLEAISQFFSGMKGGTIESLPQHQQKTIVEMMKEAIDRSKEYVIQNEANYMQLQNQHDQLKADYETLREELHSMQEIQEGTSHKLQETSDHLAAELTKNALLEEKVSNLENSLSNQQQNTSAEGIKFKNEIGTLKETITSLEEKLKERSNKCNELDRNLTVISKQLKDYEAKSENEMQKKRKQIEAKAATILRYGEIEKSLRDELTEANKQITSLKDVNENIRKRNEKGTVREKQLEDELNILKDRFGALSKKQSDLQKTYNQTSTELNTLKTNYNKLQSEDRKLKMELEAARNTIKLKQDLIVKSQNQVKTLESNKRILEKECDENNRQIERLGKMSVDLSGVKTQLEARIVELGKMMDTKDKTHNLEAEYLKPIRENLSYLKGYMAEYSRVGDQFEANKNKLLKMAGGRIEQYTDRNVADKLRDISLVFQKLKAYLLTSAGLNEKQKESVSEEVKKVQSALDRSLRGDR